MERFRTLPPALSVLLLALALAWTFPGASAAGHFWGGEPTPSPAPSVPAPGGTPPPAPREQEPVPRNLTVHYWVDTSVREAGAEAAMAFSAANPWARVVPFFAPAGEMADRIRRGEEADLLLLPGGSLVRALGEERLVTRGTVTAVGSATLVFAGKEGTAARRMADLPSLARVVAAAPDRHATGELALEALRKAGVRDEMGPRLAATAPDGREALAAAAKGEADGAFAFRTDVESREGTRVLFVVPRSLYPPAEVVVALTPRAGNNDAALCLFRFLRSDEGKRALARQGVEPLR